MGRVRETECEGERGEKTKRSGHMMSEKEHELERNLRNKQNTSSVKRDTGLSSIRESQSF